ncbi:hypothetical protein [Acinetobacter equi]|uniref:HTH cro/C1-type domain-containing protein n=1 Tax=Acinetobacter equi TaxID=1324350 RepID=A0A0N9W2A1_9GAMM|nr:hypothetical protein [Acinetobacter equi]ALH95668.1 hypothetical protein AOY20_09070 [Acinetobacter equi]
MSEYAELNCLSISSNILLSKNLIEYNSPDYGEILLILRAEFGLTHEQIAFLLPVSGSSTISEWTRGSAPNFENGFHLIELWKLLTDKTEAEVPRKNRYLFI